MSLYFTIGELFGVKFLIKYNVRIIGMILMGILIALNLLIFVKNKKYLIIEEKNFQNKKKSTRAFIIFFVFITWVIGIFAIAMKS
jgi:hypothetical protein